MSAEGPNTLFPAEETTPDVDSAPPSFIDDDRREYIDGVEQPAPFAPYIMNRRELNNVIDFVQQVDTEKDRTEKK